jgi:transmembrane sensor
LIFYPSFFYFLPLNNNPLEQQFYHITDDLLVKYLLGEASDPEKQAVLDWIAADASNQQYFDQFKLIWDTSKELALQSPIDENKAWQRFQQRVNKPAAPVKKFNPLLRVAAAVTLFIGLSIGGYFIFKSQNQPKELVILAEQQVVNDTLPDGSMVTLNKRSLLSYPEKFKGNKREVVLKGEAFFNVSPDKKKPFIIYTGETEITVVGTSFNVKSIEGTIEVVVETGIVRVTKNGQTVELNAGERTTITPQVNTPVKEAVTDKLYNYYRTREFVCDDTPLWKLVEVINEAYDVNIVIKNEDLRNQSITSPFYNESLEQVLNVISETFKLKVTYKDNQIILE